MSELREWGASAVLITALAWFLLILPATSALILVFTFKALTNRKPGLRLWGDAPAYFPPNHLLLSRNLTPAGLRYRSRLLLSVAALVFPYVAARGLEVLITPLPYDASEARAKALSWYPSGTPLDLARSGLESRGWSCKELDSLKEDAAIRCEVSLAGLPCKDTWVAELVAADNHLADIRVERQSMCL